MPAKQRILKRRWARPQDAADELGWHPVFGSETCSDHLWGLPWLAASERDVPFSPGFL